MTTQRHEQRSDIKRVRSAAPIMIALNKPFNVLTQFSDGEHRQTLKDFVAVPSVYPAGRLDKDSEGLLLLTNNGLLQNLVASPSCKMPKTYWVQVEGIPDEQALRTLSNGVELKDGKTLPAEVKLIEAPALWPRTPPIRVRQSVPDCWLELTLREGKNRQVRRMTAAVGCPTLRLIRASIGPWSVEGLQPGQWRWLELPADLLSRINRGKRMKSGDRRKHCRSG